MKIQVKFGSNLLKIKVNQETTASSVIHRILKKCNISDEQIDYTQSYSKAVKIKSKQAKRYFLFEMANGVERKLEPDEIIWNMLINNNNICFSIKLCRYSHEFRRKVEFTLGKTKKIFDLHKRQFISSDNQTAEIEAFDQISSNNQIMNNNLTDTTQYIENISIKSMLNINNKISKFCFKLKKFQNLVLKKCQQSSLSFAHYEHNNSNELFLI